MDRIKMKCTALHIEDRGVWHIHQLYLIDANVRAEENVMH